MSRSSNAGQRPAEQVLERLLRQGEAARLRGDTTPASLSMKGKQHGREYLALRGLEEFELFHARMALAQRAGAILIEREDHRDDGSRLRRIHVADLTALARELNVSLLEERVTAATALLQPWLPMFPVLTQTLENWRQGEKVRGHPVEAAEQLKDAAHAVAALQDGSGHDRILRRESVRLFGSGCSKYLERLTPWLDMLCSGELEPTGLEKEHIWSALGLRREPQPLLLSGPGNVQLVDGTHLRLIKPFLGLPIESVQCVHTPARYLLSIENLASFHDCARAAGATNGLLVYTGGMPSPAWRACYRRLLLGLPSTTTIYHWGDIDEGGFRIAAKLSAAANQAGRQLLPWQMSAASLPVEIIDAAPRPPPPLLATMRRWAELAGWPTVAADLQNQPLTLEQEMLSPCFP